MSSPDSHEVGEMVTGLRVVLCCRPSRASRTRCLSCSSLSGRRRVRWCALGATPNIVRENPRKPVDLIEGPNKVFKGRSTKGPQPHVHQWKSQERCPSMILGLCEVAIAPGCQRPPSNFSGSFALQRPGRRDRCLARCDAMPTFRPLNNHHISLICCLVFFVARNRSCWSDNLVKQRRSP